MAGPDRLTLAAISGASSRHARYHDLTAEDRPVAAAALREIGGGRADLLAEHAGVVLGVAPFRHPEETDRYQQIAALCIQAGADAAAIPRWIEVGRNRAEHAESVPHTGTHHSR